jgi:hypothetical protein
VVATRARNELHYMANWPFGRGKTKVTHQGIKAVLGDLQAGKNSIVPKLGQTQVAKAPPYVPSKAEAAAETEVRRIEGGQDARRPAQPPRQQVAPPVNPPPKKWVDDGEPF